MMPGTAGAEQVPQPGLSDSGKEALLSRAVLSAEVIAYDDLGPEALRRLEVKDLPVTVVDDATGRGLYEEGRVQYRRVTHPA